MSRVLGQITVIDPNLDIQVQHLAIKDPRLFEALTKKTKVNIEVPEDVLVVDSLRTALVGQRVEIDGINGIRIFDASNNLTVQLNGTALVIKTAATGRRVEITPGNGIEVYDGAGVLQTKFDGPIVTLPNEVIKNQHILDEAITTLKIAADAVTEAKIAVAAVTEGKIAALAVTAGKIQAGAVIAEKIAADAVTTDKLVAGAVTAIKIASGTITANEIAAGTITAGKLNISVLSAISANLGEVTSGTITGLLIRTATSGQRVEIDSINGIQIFDSSDVLTANFNGSNLAITGGTIMGGNIIGSTLRTAVTGERVEIDSANGIGVYDSSDNLLVHIRASTFSGVRAAGLQAISSSDFGIFCDSGFPRILMSDGAELFLNGPGNDRGGYMDGAGGSGAGNQPTDFVLYFQGSGGSRTARRVNVQQGTGPGAGYLYIS